jgi:hypothetical protein
MKRRAFLSLFGVAAAYRSLGARAAAGKRPVVGFLVPGTQASYAQWIDAFAQRMRALGWIDGGNVEIIYRWTEGVKERYAEIATEFVKLKVDVIVRLGGSRRGEAGDRPFPSCSRLPPIRLPSDLLKVSRIPAATSPVCRRRQPTLPVKRSNYCVSWSPGFSVWQS